MGVSVYGHVICYMCLSGGREGSHGVRKTFAFGMVESICLMRSRSGGVDLRR